MTFQLESRSACPIPRNASGGGEGGKVTDVESGQGLRGVLDGSECRRGQPEHFLVGRQLPAPTRRLVNLSTGRE